MATGSPSGGSPATSAARKRTYLGAGLWTDVAVIRGLVRGDKSLSDLKSCHGSARKPAVVTGRVSGRKIALAYQVPLKGAHLTSGRGIRGADRERIIYRQASDYLAIGNTRNSKGK